MISPASLFSFPSNVVVSESSIFVEAFVVMFDVRESILLPSSDFELTLRGLLHLYLYLKAFS